MGDPLRTYAWGDIPTAREQLAQEIRRSWLIAQQDKRRRRIRRRALYRRKVRPVLAVLLLLLLIVIGLWDTTPQMP